MKRYKLIEYQGRKIKMASNYANQLIKTGKAKDIEKAKEENEPKKPRAKKEE
jgi:hypothetical protein